MIKYNSNNISDWDFGTSNIVKVYHNNAVCYHKIGATPPFQGKWKATYSGGSITTAACDSTSAITENEITKTDLESFVIGDCVTTIGDYAFGGCDSLTSVTIGSGVTSIGNGAFEGCTSLTSIDIPDSVTSIGSYAFNGCTSFSSVTIPSGVTTIGKQAFGGCQSLTSITVNATNPPTLGSVVFIFTNDCPIYVPSASVETYKAAWSQYASRIQAKL